MSDIEFVITAPEENAADIAYENAVRQTHGVLIDIVLAARSYILVSSPYLKDLKDVNPALNYALISALKMGVTLNILSTEESILLANIEQYKDYNVFLFKPNEEYSKNQIRSHAKFFLSDGAQVYLGSANFTAAGLKYNIEMGVYGKGILAKQVESFWKYLINNGLLVPIKI